MGYYLNKSSKPGKRGLASFLIVSVLLLLITPFIYSRAIVEAAPLAEAGIRLDRVAVNEQFDQTGGYRILVFANPATTATEGRVAITFPDDTSGGFTLNSDDTQWDTSTTGITSETVNGTALTAWPTIQSEATSVTDNGNDTTVVYTSGDMSPGTIYGFYIICETGQACVTNPSSAGEQIITIETQEGGSTPIDNSDVAVDIVSAGGDQVTVTATVPPTFNFDVQDTALALGTLSTGSVSTDAMSSPIDIDTNAQNGYAAWIRSASPAATLASATTGDDISSTHTGSPVTCSPGTECYVVDAAVTTGSPTTEYDGNGSTSGGVLDTDYEEFANHTAAVADEQITLTVIVAISGTTEAASDYTDTWEVVGAGNF